MQNKTNLRKLLEIIKKENVKGLNTEIIEQRIDYIETGINMGLDVNKIISNLSSEMKEAINSSRVNDLEVKKEIRMFKMYMMQKHGYEVKTVNEEPVENPDSLRGMKINCDDCGECEETPEMPVAFELKSLDDLPKFLQKIIEEQIK